MALRPISRGPSVLHLIAAQFMKGHTIEFQVLFGGAGCKVVCTLGGTQEEDGSKESWILRGRVVDGPPALKNKFYMAGFNTQTRKGQFDVTD